MKTTGSFVSIGAGNVATHLCKALCNEGLILKQVYSRSENSCVILASRYNAGYTTSIDDITENADFYLVAVPDHVLPEILKRIKFTGKLIFHTAGTFGLDVFKGRFNRCGILYPLQTFNKERRLDLSNVPIIVEGCDQDTENAIIKIAGKLSRQVMRMKQEKRKWLHLSAVFVSNFTNHLFVVANDLLKKENLDFRLLYTLMDETLRKAESGNPRNGQTGPAIRGDANTMRYHLKLLAGNSDMQKLYTFMSRNISEYHSEGQSKKSLK